MSYAVLRPNHARKGAEDQTTQNSAWNICRTHVICSIVSEIAMRMPTQVSFRWVNLIVFCKNQETARIGLSPKCFSMRARRQRNIWWIYFLILSKHLESPRCHSRFAVQTGKGSETKNWRFVGIKMVHRYDMCGYTAIGLPKVSESTWFFIESRVCPCFVVLVTIRSKTLETQMGFGLLALMRGRLWNSWTWGLVGSFTENGYLDLIAMFHGQCLDPKRCTMQRELRKIDGF